MCGRRLAAGTDAPPPGGRPLRGRPHTRSTARRTLRPRAGAPSRAVRCRRRRRAGPALSAGHAHERQPAARSDGARPPPGPRGARCPRVERRLPHARGPSGGDGSRPARAPGVDGRRLRRRRREPRRDRPRSRHGTLLRCRIQLRRGARVSSRGAWPRHGRARHPRRRSARRAWRTGRRRSGDRRRWRQASICGSPAATRRRARRSCRRIADRRLGQCRRRAHGDRPFGACLRRERRPFGGEDRPHRRARARRVARDLRSLVAACDARQQYRDAGANAPRARLRDDQHRAGVGRARACRRAGVRRRRCRGA
jgi:hypothetical protein